MIRKSESGQALVIGAFVMVALLAVMGLSIDMGVMRYDKRLQQTAADAAAIAGASNLPYDGAGSPGVINGALTASAQNGFTSNTGSSCAPPPTDLNIGQVDVTVCNPPITGPHAGDANYVQAYVSAGQPTFFMKALGVTRETITAAAVATTLGSNGPGSGCLLTLGPPNASIEGVNVNGNPTLNAPTCGIQDNGDFNTKGNALVVSASTFGTSGNWVNDGTQPGDVTCTSGQSPCPSSTVGVADPLSSLKAPATSYSGGSTVSISGGGDSSCGVGCSYDSSTNTYSIQPGQYCSITINGTAQDSVVFEPGLYIIDGISSGCTTESLNIPGNATITGDGVTFYFTNSSTLNMTGTPTMHLTAPGPTEPYPGPYAGILFYQDPNDTNTNGPSLGGNTGSYYDGMLYFPSDQLTFYGNNTSVDIAMAITYSVHLSGNPTVNLDGASAMPPGSDPVKTAVLVQ